MSAALTASTAGAPAQDAFAEAADLSNKELEKRLNTLAGHINAATGVFLVYLCAFDLAGGWHGFASCAQWLSHQCGMSLHTANQHVRVARRLRELPVMRQALVEGRLSFSKVRALTRIATAVTEADLVATALGCSATQLDKICGAVARALTDDQAQDRRARVRFNAYYDTDGMLVGSFRLAPEEGAVLMAAIDARLPDRILETSETQSAGSRPRRDSVGEQPAPANDDAAPDELSDPVHRLDRSRAAAFVDVARDAMANPSPDGPAPTVAEVVVHVNGSQLDRVLAERATLTGTAQPTTRPVPVDPRPQPSQPVRRAEGAASGGSRPPTRPGGLAVPVQRWNGGELMPTTRQMLDAALDTSCDDDGRPFACPPLPDEAVGWVEDGPGLALTTIERLLCDGSVRTRCGHEHPDAPDPRARRQPSRAQRRALWRRDRGCRAPGCTRRRALHAHHVIPWWKGGPTILANLVLLCTAHHHLVHEGGWVLTIKDHRVVLTSPDGAKTLVEGEPIEGDVQQMVELVAADVDERTLTGEQDTAGFSLEYAVGVIAPNIELAERLARETESDAGVKA